MTRQMAYYYRKSAELIALLGGECKHCGAKENLEFDHTDPTTKSFEIMASYSLPMEQLKPELDKCQLLCDPCHNLKTQQERGHKMEHGKDSMYRHAKCRCNPCKDAHSKVMAEYTRKKKAELGPNWRARDRKKQL